MATIFNKRQTYSVGEDEYVEKFRVAHAVLEDLVGAQLGQYRQHISLDTRSSAEIEEDTLDESIRVALDGKHGLWRFYTTFSESGLGPPLVTLTGEVDGTLNLTVRTEDEGFFHSVFARFEREVEDLKAASGTARLRREAVQRTPLESAAPQADASDSPAAAAVLAAPEQGVTPWYKRVWPYASAVVLGVLVTWIGHLLGWNS